MHRVMGRIYDAMRYLSRRIFIHFKFFIIYVFNILFLKDKIDIKNNAVRHLIAASRHDTPKQKGDIHGEKN